MKISELIKALQALKRKHGDQPVTLTWTQSCMGQLIYHYDCYQAAKKGKQQ